MIGILAYLDPATGSIVVQMVVGALVGVGVFCRRTLFRVLGMFRRGRDRSAVE